MCVSAATLVSFVFGVMGSGSLGCLVLSCLALFCAGDCCAVVFVCGGGSSFGGLSVFIVDWCVSLEHCLSLASCWSCCYYCCCFFVVFCVCCCHVAGSASKRDPVLDVSGWLQDR